MDAGTEPGGVAHFFNYHQVVWFENKIYDATARLDSDDDPTTEKAEDNSGYVPVGLTEAAYKADALRSDGDYDEDMTVSATGDITVE